jgi:hypothetical protein
MSTYYTAGMNSTTTTTGTARFQLVAPATLRPKVLEVGLTIGAATASTFGLYRSASVGTASTTVVGVPHDPGEPAALTTLQTAWSAAPTISTNVPIRRIALPATAGAGFIWQFYDDPLVIPVSGGILLWALTAVANVQDFYVVWRE